MSFDKRPSFIDVGLKIPCVAQDDIERLKVRIEGLPL